MAERAKKPKDRLAWLEKQGHIRPEHVVLGEQIIKLRETRDREPSPHMHFDQGAGGGGGNAVLKRLHARQKWERFFAAVGPEGEAVISCVVIDGKSLGDTAKELNLHPKAILPLLRFALDVMGRQ